MIAVIPVKLVDEGFDWPAWITLGVVFISAAFAFWALLNAKRSRHGQLIIELDALWTSTEIVDSLKLYWTYPRKDLAALVAKLYDRESKERPTPKELVDYQELLRSANLVETIGVLRSERALSAKVVYKMWGGGIVTVWTAWADAVPLIRKYTGELDAFKYFMEVSQEMEGRMKHVPTEPARRAMGALESGSLAEAEAGLERIAQSSVPHSSASTTRRWVVALTSLVAVSAIYRWLRRRVSA